MPKITFETDWLKIGNNVESGDRIQFLDTGKQNEDGQWVFEVGVIKSDGKGGEDIVATKKFGLNKTNFKAVSKLYTDNSDEWVHKEMTVEKIKRQNPRTGEMVDSIALIAPEEPKKEDKKDG